MTGNALIFVQRSFLLEQMCSTNKFDKVRCEGICGDVFVDCLPYHIEIQMHANLQHSVKPKDVHLANWRFAPKVVCLAT